MSSYSVRTRADSGEIRKAAQAIEQAAWARFGFLNFTRSHYDHYANLLDQYSHLQLCLVDDNSGYVVAASSCVPFEWDGSPLPEEGWDWAVEQASRSTSPNAACMLAISVPELHRSRGLARRLIHAVRERVEQAGLTALVAPVRPSMKSRHPDVSIDDYTGWRDDGGRHYDSWMRSHESCGGTLVGACHRSMVVDEPLGFWEAWLGHRFDRAGSHIIPGALAPIEVDLDRGRARYEEPNVWFRYA